MLFIARQQHRSVSFCSMPVLSAVFIDGARLLSRGSIVDTLQGIPALIKEKDEIKATYTMERFRLKTHLFVYRLHQNDQKRIFSKKVSKRKETVPFLA